MLISQTLISSTAALSAVWVEFAKQYNMDLDDLVRTLRLGLLTPAP